MLPGVWVKMASCSLRSPHMSGDSSVCLSVVKRSPCLFSLLWNDMFSSLPNSSRVGSLSHTRPICVPSSLSMLGWLEDSQNRITNEPDPPDRSMFSPTCFPPTPNLFFESSQLKWWDRWALLACTSPALGPGLVSGWEVGFGCKNKERKTDREQWEL